MKQFDEQFSRKAKEAFDNYDADHLAEAGWNSYVTKYVKKRTRALVIPLWARAASIIVLVTFGILFTARFNNRKSGDSVSQVAQEPRSGLTESEIIKDDTATASPVIVSPDQASEPTVSKTGLTRHAGREKTDYQATEPAGSVLAGTTNVAGMSAGMNLPDNPVEIRLTDDSEVRLKLNPKETHPGLADIPREKMTTTIMGGLSGMMAGIDKAASVSQGVSIGFYVEQQLTRRISVRPGLAMAKHNYIMESVSGGNIAMDYSAPELNGMTGTTTSYDADIDVVSMEVPVNFVFSLRKRARSNLFVTTGASTVVYLSQHMSGSFDNTYTRSTVDASTGQVSYESMTTTVMIESEQEPLNRVDFLGLANFSAGYSIPFGKTSHLLFEPFVQLPLRDLTSLNLRIRYGGLSMKIQF